MAIDNYKVLIEGDPEEGGDIVEFFNEILDNKSLSFDIKFAFITNSKQKSLIKLTKIPDHYAVLTNAMILVTINEEYYNALINEDDILKILFEQEIDKIETNMEKMTFKIAKHNVSTSLGIVQKYTFENIQRAILTEAALEEQLKDKKE